VPETGIGAVEAADRTGTAETAKGIEMDMGRSSVGLTLSAAVQKAEAVVAQSRISYRMLSPLVG